MLTFEQVNALLRYDPETGLLYWRKNKMGRQLHKPAGSCDRFGYRRIMIDYKQNLAHRLAWLLYYKTWPKGHIDHIDGNPRNNRISNLRDVNRSTNLKNNYKRRNRTLAPRTLRDAPYTDRGTASNH